MVDKNARSGVWVQGSGATSGLTVTHTTLSANTFAGLTAAAAGRLAFDGGAVRDTRLGELEYLEGIDFKTTSVGDGVSIAADCDAQVTGSQFIDNARLGIVVSQATARLTGNTVTGNPRAIVLQEVGDAVVATENDLRDNGVNEIGIDIDPVQLLSTASESVVLDSPLFGIGLLRGAAGGRQSRLSGLGQRLHRARHRRWRWALACPQ